MSWPLMAGKAPDEREQYAGAVLLEAGFPTPSRRHRPSR